MLSLKKRNDPMRVSLSISIFYFSLAAMPLCGQIPNLPTMNAPSASSLGSYGNQNFGNPYGRNSPNISQGIADPYYNNPATKRAQDMTAGYEAKAKQQNEAIMREIDEAMVQQEQIKMQEWVENGRNMSYDLPSLAGTAGTGAYYDAFDKLSVMDTENYSLAEVNFTVESAFYGNVNKQNLAQFKAGIQKTAKQLLQKMKERKQDTESNVAKNLMLFEYFSKDMNIGGANHKAYEYDFKDYLGEKDWSKMFVSKLLKTGSGQCHSLPLLYLIIAEAMGTEAYLSLAPNHSYIRFIDDEQQLRNIELTNGMFSTDTSLLETGFIKSEALQNQIYMSNLSKKELLGMAYFDLARGYVHKFGYDEFVNKVIEKALQLYPNGIAPNMEKANVERARFLSAVNRLGINPQDRNDLQKIGYFPKAIEQVKQGTEQMKHIDELGYAEMPPAAYEAWLASLKTETNRQQSEALMQRIHLYELQKQKDKQEAAKKAQEKKKEEQKPKYFPIDPSKL